MEQHDTTKANMLQPGDRFLTPAEAAQFLGTSVHTLSYRRTKGNGPPYYFHGRSIRYLLSDLTKWATLERVNG